MMYTIPIKRIFLLIRSPRIIILCKKGDLMKNFLVFLGLIAAFLAHFFIKSFIQFSDQEKQRDVFKPHIHKYISGPYQSAFTNEPYVRGKILSIDVKDSTVDELTFSKLPDELRAASNDEVGTILLCEWYRIKEGEYFSEDTNVKTGDAYRSYANVSIIDVKENKMIHIKNFKGQDPLKATNIDGDFTSMQPMFELIDYIKGLPRK